MDFRGDPGRPFAGDAQSNEARAACHGRAFAAGELAALGDLAADWLWETDADHRFVWLSDGFTLATGVSAQEVVGRSRLDKLLRFPRDGAKKTQFIDRLLAREPFRDFVHEMRDGGAQLRWLSISGMPVFADDGTFLGYRGTGRDLTEVLSGFGERDVAPDKAAVPLSQADMLMSALNVMDEALCYYDSDDRLVLCNDAMRSMYPGLEDMIRPGVTLTEMLEASCARGILNHEGQDRDDFISDVLARRRERVKSQSRSLVNLSDGRWVMHRDVRTRDGGTVGVRADITDYKRREDELAAAQKKAEQLSRDLERTLDTVDLGIVLLNRNLKADIINKAFYAMWSLSPEKAPRGVGFDEIMEFNRHNAIYDVPDSEWEDFVSWRLDEIRNGDVAPREFARADGRTVIYSVTTLTDGKRLVTYFDVTAMKEREAQLGRALEQAKLAEAVINSVPSPMFVKDRDLTFVMANQAFADFFDTVPAELIGKKAADFVTPSEAMEFEENERHVLATGNHYEVEEDFDASGSTHTRMVRKNRVRTASGNSYVACSMFDVTELNRRKVEAETARNYVASVLETLPAGVIIYDKDDRFVLANRKVQDALPAMVEAMQPGKPLREAVELAHKAGYFRSSGDPELDALYDVDREAWIEGYVARYHHAGVVYERENPDGRWFQVFDTRKSDGTFVGVRVDITELKQREQALRESMSKTELFAHVLDELPVSTYVKSRDLKFEFVNKAWCAIGGVTKEEAMGKTDRDFFGAEGDGFAERDLNVIATGEMDETEEVLTHRDGTTRHLIARKSRLVGQDGRVHLIGSSADITELKQREAELEDAQRRAVLADRAKSEFLANMSHEIRTPMNGVLGMAELLAKTELEKKQRTFVDIIVKSGNALLTIINDILDFSKIDAGQLALDPAPFDLEEAIEDVATLMAARAKEKDLELIVRVAPGLQGSFVGDAGRIRQIVTNLVGNAVKFTDTGHVVVEVAGKTNADGAKLDFRITDTGIGIPADMIDQVFEKFSQVDGSSTRRHEGTGLGLAITSRLVALMGGTMGVESTEGKGSTFWFSIELPLAEQRMTQRVTPVDVTGARILVVDDNEVNRSILLEQMASWGFDACACESGYEGIAVLEAIANIGSRVDCMILDYQMPGMTGVDVARAVRAMAKVGATPIVMLTSVDQSLSRANSKALDIDAQLTKPARSSELLETLVETIQKRRFAGSDMEGETPAAPQPPVQHAPASPTLDAGSAQRSQSEPADRAPRETESQVDILVAEDNEVNQLVFSQILAETPHTFKIVGNGRLAVEAFGRLAPRMILMDVSMPEMGGLEATGKIREIEGDNGGHVPIIGVTAHALKGDRERCLEAGMDDYLSKPISPKALLEKIERWAGGSDAHRRQSG